MSKASVDSFYESFNPSKSYKESVDKLKKNSKWKGLFPIHKELPNYCHKLGRFIEIRDTKAYKDYCWKQFVQPLINNLDNAIKQPGKASSDSYRSLKNSLINNFNTDFDIFIAELGFVGRPDPEENLTKITNITDMGNTLLTVPKKVATEICSPRNNTETKTENYTLSPSGEEFNYQDFDLIAAQFANEKLKTFRRSLSKEAKIEAINMAFNAIVGQFSEDQILSVMPTGLRTPSAMICRIAAYKPEILGNLTPDSIVNFLSEARDDDSFKAEVEGHKRSTMWPFFLIVIAAAKKTGAREISAEMESSLDIYDNAWMDEFCGLCSKKPDTTIEWAKDGSNKKIKVPKAVATNAEIIQWVKAEWPSK